MIRILLAIAMFVGAPASAQMLWSSLDEVVEIEVRSGWRAPNGRHMAALEVRLAQGWKTYWRSPGSTGIAPRFQWSGSKNLAGVAVHWPTPSAFMTGGYPSLGYMESFILPVELQPSDPNAPITLSAHIEIGVCLDICLPAKLTITAELPPAGPRDEEIAAALKDRPRAGQGQVICAIRPSSSGIMLAAEIPHATPLGNTEVVAVELLNAQDRVWIADTMVVREGRVLRTKTEFIHPDETAVSLNRSDLRFTVVGAQGAVEYFGCASR